MPFGINKVALFGVAGAVTDSAILIQSQTTASAASIEFTTGITSAYKQYIFKFYTVAPITNAQKIYMKMSTDGGSSYGVATTTSYYAATHNVVWDTTAAVAYEPSRDVTNATDPLPLTHDMANATQSAGGNNIPGANMVGELILFNPSSTTYSKMFYSRWSFNFYLAGAYSSFVGGLVNSTSAINAIQFYSSSGNIAGTIKMWGVL